MCVYNAHRGPGANWECEARVVGSLAWCIIVIVELDRVEGNYGCWVDGGKY